MRRCREFIDTSKLDFNIPSGQLRMVSAYVVTQTAWQTSSSVKNFENYLCYDIFDHIYCPHSECTHNIHDSAKQTKKSNRALHM